MGKKTALYLTSASRKIFLKAAREPCCANHWKGGAGFFGRDLEKVAYFLPSLLHVRPSSNLHLLQK
jgi:hypothetical protein